MKSSNRHLSKDYTFTSESDCEVLLPMYEKYGVGMFAKLDAEFACILYDGKQKKFIAARDPIGIRPLYYGYDGNGTILFASEPKNLVGLTDKILPFPPGHYYCDGKFVCYCDIAAVDHVLPDDSGNGLRQHPRQAGRRCEEASGGRRQGRLPAQRRTGFLSGVRHCRPGERKAHPHLCHRHE